MTPAGLFNTSQRFRNKATGCAPLGLPGVKRISHNSNLKEVEADFETNPFPVAKMEPFCATFACLLLRTGRFIKSDRHNIFDVAP
jgi:hypothetical protein